MDFGRLLTAMVTPFDEQGQVDYKQAQDLALALVESGSDGVVVAGTTGEAPTLSHDEKLRLVAEIKNVLHGRGAVIAGTGTYNTAESIDLSREAEKAGADGLLLTVPYYNRPTQEGLYRHFEAIARAVSLPCILYNIPGRTGVNMAADTTLRLAGVSNIVGVKEASGDLIQIARIITEAPEDFLLWSGDDQMTLPVLALGGYGVICVTSHLAGMQVRQMIETQLCGLVNEAASIHRSLLPLMNVLMTAASNPIPIKYALNAIGVRVGAPRLPLIEADEAAASRIMAELRNHEIDLRIEA